MRQKGSRQPPQIGILLKNGNWRDLFMLEANVQQSRILEQKNRLSESDVCKKNGRRVRAVSS